jgi:hypothetical protein
MVRVDATADAEATVHLEAKVRFGSLFSVDPIVRVEAPVDVGQSFTLKQRFVSKERSEWTQSQGPTPKQRFSPGKCLRWTLKQSLTPGPGEKSFTLDRE